MLNFKCIVISLIIAVVLGGIGSCYMNRSADRKIKELTARADSLEPALQELARFDRARADSLVELRRHIAQADSKATDAQARVVTETRRRLDAEKRARRYAELSLNALGRAADSTLRARTSRTPGR